MPGKLTREQVDAGMHVSRQALQAAISTGFARVGEQVEGAPRQLFEGLEAFWRENHDDLVGAPIELAREAALEALGVGAPEITEESVRRLTDEQLAAGAERTAGQAQADAHRVVEVRRRLIEGMKSLGFKALTMALGAGMTAMGASAREDLA